MFKNNLTSKTILLVVNKNLATTDAVFKQKNLLFKVLNIKSSSLKEKKHQSTWNATTPQLNSYYKLYPEMKASKCCICHQNSVVVLENFLELWQRYTYRVLQTIQMNPMLLWVWAEWAVLGRAKSALKFKYWIEIG